MDLGETLRQDLVDVLRGKKLIVHFDGELVRQLEEENDLTVNCERIAFSVTSPDLECRDDYLLGKVQAKIQLGLSRQIYSLISWNTMILSTISLVFGATQLHPTLENFREQLQSYQLSLIQLLPGACVVTILLKYILNIL